MQDERTRTHILDRPENPGRHPLLAHLPTIDQQYKNLCEAMRARGIEVFNLSSNSLLTAFPKMEALLLFEAQVRKIAYVQLISRTYPT